MVTKWTKIFLDDLKSDLMEGSRQMSHPQVYGESGGFWILTALLLVSMPVRKRHHTD